MKYEIKIKHALEKKGTIDLQRLAAIAEGIKKISEGALQIRLRGVSLTKGRKKISLKDALKKVKEILTSSSKPLLYGFSNTSCEAQLEGIKLAELIGRLNCHVNLIPLNENAHYQGRRPKQDKIKKFERILINKRIPTSIRNSLGSEISAGCGQLAGQL